MGHHHHETTTNPACGDRRTRMGRAAATNAGLFVFSAVTGLVSGNHAFLAEAMHDAGDTATHSARYVAEARGIDQDSARFRRFRKAAMFLVSGLSAVTAVKLGVDISDGLDKANSFGRQMYEFGSSGVVAVGNIYAYQQMNAVEEHSHASHDSHHHARTDMVASLGLSACIAADALGLHGAAEWGGIAFASYTAYEMFPTNNRLEHH